MPGAAAIPPTVANSLTERAFQSQVLDLASLHGWRSAHFHDSRREVVRRDGERLIIGDKGCAGFPDLVLARPPELLVVELKAEKGRLSDAQRAWLQALECCGVEVYVWRPSDWPSIEARLGRRVA